MKSIYCALVLGAFCLHTSAFAQCGNFGELVKDALAFEAHFAGGTPGKLQCTNKPNEAVADEVISCFEDTNWQPARMQSEADVRLAALYGIITGCYRSGLGQEDPGKKAFHDIVAATQVDPSYEPGWIGFSGTIIAFKQLNFIQKGFVQSVLGINIDDEVKVAIQGLEGLPPDAAVDANLDKLKSFHFSPEDSMGLETLEALQ